MSIERYKTLIAAAQRRLDSLSLRNVVLQAGRRQPRADG